ncbi:hypothetical protein SmphiM12_005 [Sinorhizobium phage phiM12]|uniref:Uncharacterized protein n=1 Tax=Sinorhizobium phage phiM12 TaxID=1357423 RepID=S5MUW8_9CAUD|nr:hypothetical protein AB690_gp003 [Sinorhizobium phage phiM12]AGR47637.2 hypothetical protein SmphiM12_005 [Sinorhizobium phage phiM12]
MTTYVVLNGHTLGYLFDGFPTDKPEWMGVLAGSVLLGGYDWKNGPVVVLPGNDVRLATKEDFDFFRVSWKGHLE